VIAEHSPQYLMLFIAAQRLGIILVPLNYRYTSTEMLHCLKDVSPSLIIAEDVKFETQILDLKERVNTQIISFGSFFEKAQTISLEDFEPDFKIEKEQPILFSSPQGQQENLKESFTPTR